MPLDLSRLVAGQNARAADVHQFGDVLLGVMQDQPVSFKHQLSVGGGTAIGAAQVPFTVNGVAAQSANLVEIKNSVGTLLYHIGPAGDVTVAGTLSAGTLSAPTAQITALNTSGLLTASGGLTVTGSATTLSDTTIGGVGLRLSSPVGTVPAGQVGLGNNNNIATFVAGAGVGTIKFSDGTARTNSGWWLVSVGGATYYVPLFVSN